MKMTSTHLAIGQKKYLNYQDVNRLLVPGRYTIQRRTKVSVIIFKIYLYYCYYIY